MGTDSATKSGKGRVIMGKSRIIGRKVNKDEWKIKVKTNEVEDILIFITGLIKGTYDNFENQENKARLTDLILKLAEVLCRQYGKDFEEEILTND